MKFVILALIAAVLLLYGCTNYITPPAENQQQQNGQVVGNDRDSHGCIGSAGYSWCAVLNKCIRTWETNCTAVVKEPAPVVQTEPKKQYTCSLTLTPSTIEAGHSTDVGFSVATKDNVIFTYDCGSEKREIATGGLTGGERLCDYAQPGTYTVSIYADGVPCASQMLTVQTVPGTTAGKSCSANLTKSDIGTHYYEITAYFDGFPSTDSIKWICDYTTTESGIETAGNLGTSRQKTLTCQYTDKPAHNYIDVYVGGILCNRVTIPV
ncbi:MAG: hypothetical protein NTV88_04510 [Candidatus Micrarchaeota archaeon]|nr:hypothetical protein [Candidatus Micrarchaeota archaeon]